MKILRCADVIPDCEVEVRAESEDELLDQAAQHARRDHGLEEIDDATLRKVKAAIHDE